MGVWREVLSMCMGTCVSVGDRKEDFVEPSRRRKKEWRKSNTASFRQISARSDYQFSNKLGSKSSVLLPRSISLQCDPEPG